MAIGKPTWVLWIMDSIGPSRRAHPAAQSTSNGEQLGMLLFPPTTTETARLISRSGDPRLDNGSLLRAAMVESLSSNGAHPGTYPCRATMTATVGRTWPYGVRLQELGSYWKAAEISS